MEIKLLKPDRVEDRPQLSASHDPWGDRTVISALLLLFLTVIILRSAWITEDAYIMFRSIENFVNGRGLGWNMAERVQTYTCPLWMFILAGLRAFTGELYFTTISAGIFFTLGAVWVLCRRVAVSSMAVVLAVVPLIVSKAFIDHSTSGLENPVTYLTIALFGAIYLREGTLRPSRYLFTLSFIAALAMLNRMDTILFFAPALAFEVLRLRGWRYTGWIAAAFAPLVAWLAFSLFYYGFPFPNTAYAKLNTGVSAYMAMRQGLQYLLNSLSLDPVTLFMIIGGCVIMVWQGRWKGMMLAAGIALYVFYTVRVGGDFMSGRFLAAPLFASVLGLAAFLPAAKRNVHAVGILAGILLLANASPDSPLNTGAGFKKEFPGAVDVNGIADERAFYYPQLGFLNSHPGRFPDHPWRNAGEAAAAAAHEVPVVVFGNIGIFGYYAGPDVHIVDHYALADPLLARLPAIPYSRIGHFKRELPPGYVESWETGTNQIRHPSLARYHDALSMVVAGPLFSMERIREIIRLNTGHYDHLLDEYVQNRYMPHSSLSDLLEPMVLQDHTAGHPFIPDSDGVWALGGETHLLFDIGAEYPDTLFFTVTTPFPEQTMTILFNWDVIFEQEFTQEDTLRVAVPFIMHNTRNWLTIRNARWNSESDQISHDTDVPYAVKFHRLGISGAVPFH